MPASSGRLQIGKPGAHGSSNWAFGGALGPGSTSGSLAQPRTASGMPSFAQTIGNSQPNTPLDLSEFPSLTSNPSSQQNNPQNAWNAANQRNGSTWNSSNRNQTQPTHQQQQENMFAAFSAQQPLPESRGAPQAQPEGTVRGQKTASNPDEFPPLGMRTGNIGGTIGEENKNSSYQQSQTKGPGNMYNGASPSRNGPGHDRQVTSAIGSGMGNGPPGGAFAMGKQYNPQLQHNQAHQDRVDSEERPRDGENGAYQAQSAFGQSHNANEHGSEMASLRDLGQPPSMGEFSRFNHTNPAMTNGSGTTEAIPLEAMAPSDRYGMSGLLSLMRQDPLHPNSLARGQDLTNLRLEIDEPSNTPLWRTFASPWPETSTRPIEPEFEVPSCYKVENVPPLIGKISSLTEESLFYAFYSLVGDAYQELAAQELISRGWRYLKPERTWLSKDQATEPIQVGPTEERGKYIIWNKERWCKDSREIRLDYRDLDDHAPPQGLLHQGLGGLPNGKQS